jgi:hypothetical protein
MDRYVKKALRTLLTLLWWQTLLFAPLAAVRLLLTSAGLNRASAGADELRLASIGDGLVLKSEAQAFRGGAITWIAGGVVLDLRRAQLSLDGADLRLVTAMGGTVVIVPLEWAVELDQNSVMAGASAPAPSEGSGPALRISALTVMGGLNVVRKEVDAVAPSAGEAQLRGE